MIPRTAGKTLLELAKGFPVVSVCGPRQSGKTTLTQAVFPEKIYVSLDDPDELTFAQEDPRGFLDRFPDGAVLDEAQRCPELFNYLQTRVDRAGRLGMFILSGSQQFLLMEKIGQSLAGRVGILTLLPFSLEELQNENEAPENLRELLYKGFYPPLYDRPVNPSTWFSSYFATYVERDLRQVLQVRDLRTFRTFFRLCAGRTGQLLNLSSLGNDCGVSHNTIKTWLSVLETSSIIFLLPPYHRNFGKRLVKTPKLYFCDPGLAAYLLGIQSSEQLLTHPMRGELFETCVVGEVMKHLLNNGDLPNLYFWRDHIGREVDLVVEHMGEILSLEVKSGKTLVPDFFSGLEYWQSLSGSPSSSSCVVYGGGNSATKKGIKIVSWSELPKHLRKTLL